MPFSRDNMTSEELWKPNENNLDYCCQCGKYYEAKKMQMNLVTMDLTCENCQTPPPKIINFIPFLGLTINR